MRKYLVHCIIAVCLITLPSFCEEIGYVFSDKADFEVSNATISVPNLTDTVTFTTAGPSGSGSSYASEKKIAQLQEVFDRRIEPEKVVDDAQDMIVGVSPGEHTIGQVCVIYEKIKNNWNISGDPRGTDYYRFANETLRQGKKANLIGAGDCDDFALLMASMIESIGGSTRVILAYSPSGSHAYAEVYLGKKGSYNVNEIKKWLMLKYGVDQINTHWNKENGDIWLNLDWGKNIAIAAYPGASFFDASEHIPIYIKNSTTRNPLNPSPMALFENPPLINVGEPANFNASRSLNIDGIIEFDWNFGDGSDILKGPEFNVSKTYYSNGTHYVTLSVKDNQGAVSSFTSAIDVNKPPFAEFNVSPEKPKAGDLVIFDSSQSNDHDGRIVERHWSMDNRPNSVDEIAYKKYSTSGVYWVNLTTIDDRGAKSTKSLHLRINSPPIARFVPGRYEVNVGEAISFDATDSQDTDGGTIASYDWDFGDEVHGENKLKVEHSFSSPGEKIVTLVVKDNDSAQSAPVSHKVKVNRPPVAAFTYEIKEGNKVEFDASSSKGEDATIEDYYWDFDDDSGILKSNSKIKHRYEDPGQYNVTLTVIDEKESTGTSIQQINLEADKPTEKAGNSAPISIKPQLGIDVSALISNMAYENVTSNASPAFADMAGYEIIEPVGTAAHQNIHASGKLEMGQAQTADLDEGIVGVGGDSDIFFRAVSQSNRYIEPYWSGARIIYASDASRLGECSSFGPSSSSLNRINVDQQLVGTYIGVITDKGRCAEVHVLGVDDPSPGIIRLEYTTLS